MSNNTSMFRRKISSAQDLQSVVRTMKALAASSIGQYEDSVSALSYYYRAVELGLAVCLQANASSGVLSMERQETESRINVAVVFGSDQGLVGQFNDVVVDYTIKKLADLPGESHVLAIGERVQTRLADAGLDPQGDFNLPSSVGGIVPLISQIQLHSGSALASDAALYLFHNQPRPGSQYEPVCLRLLPFDAAWQQAMTDVSWPTKNLPEIIGDGGTTLHSLIREYIFISLFRACAESLASENASRLTAMQRADKNIEELLGNMRVTFNRLRQKGIDEELFDLISGFEALVKPT
jgi:F-type H+-transporting ATPase subunit gamma